MLDQLAKEQERETTTHSVLRIDGLYTAFSSADRAVRAVRGVSLVLERGETLVLLGESGSGKSVMLRSLQKLAGPSATYSGTVSIGGEDVLSKQPSALEAMRGTRVALVPQDPAASLDPLRRVGKQIEEALITHRVVSDRRAARARAIELLDRVGIPSAEQVVRRFPHELSGGMRQRVAIAIAISCGPDLLLADEPTTALDVTIQAQILALFQSLQHELGMAILFVTHDVGVAAQIADHVAVMYAGRVVEQGAAVEVLSDPQHPYTRALLAAVPTPGSVRGGLAAIPGTPPALDRPITGCAFAARCPYARDSCAAGEPDLEPVSQHHTAACPVTAEMRVAR